ncbi:hypothetical protein G9A89_006463 [Geosiphon pyriformis]|nr:hypothetical protein G9A89_006463 [Geosiphon pyriformis]
MDLVHCKKCGHFGHSALKYDMPTVSTSRPLYPVIKIHSEECYLQLAKLYVKKSVSISYSAAFGDKSWVQVILLASSSGGSHFNSGSESGSPSPNISTDKGNTLIA